MRLKIILGALAGFLLIVLGFYIRYLSNKVDRLEADNARVQTLAFELNKAITRLQESYAISIEYIYELQEAKNSNTSELNKVRKELNNYDDSKEISPILNHSTNYIIERLHKQSK